MPRGYGHGAPDAAGCGGCPERYPGRDHVVDQNRSRGALSHSPVRGRAAPTTGWTGTMSDPDPGAEHADYGQPGAPRHRFGQRCGRIDAEQVATNVDAGHRHEGGDIRWQQACEGSGETIRHAEHCFVLEAMHQPPSCTAVVEGTPDENARDHPIGGGPQRGDAVCADRLGRDATAGDTGHRHPW